MDWYSERGVKSLSNGDAWIVVGNISNLLAPYVDRWKGTVQPGGLGVAAVDQGNFLVLEGEQGELR